MVTLAEALDAYQGGGDKRRQTRSERDVLRGAWLTSARRLSCASPIVALSLGGLRRRIEALLMPDSVVLHLDGLAERERHRRRAQLAR